MIDRVAMRRIVLEQIQVHVQRRLPNMVTANVEGFCFLEPVVDAMLVGLDAHVLGLPTDRIDVEVQYPRDWWQAVRERWCPAWWVRRFPVRYRRVSIHEQRYAAVCPHLRTDPRVQHVEWLAERRDEAPQRV